MEFDAVERVARPWISDFCFRALCHYSREQNSDKFQSTLRAFEAFIDDDSKLQEDQQTKRTICCFLSRIMDGRNLDVHYETDERVTPLMSALLVWDVLKDTVSDTKLYQNIANMLCIQAVGVCLENGNTQLAQDTLKWVEQETHLPEKLQRKLAVLVSKKDMYDQLLTSFSYSRLLDNVHKFLQLFLQQNPSDFLLQSALKVVQAGQERAEEPESDAQAAVTDTATTEKRKRKLLATTSSQPWKPETVKKLRLLRKTPQRGVNRENCKNATTHSAADVKPRTKRKWTSKEDMTLRAGVRMYGEGKWAKILEQFEFEGRTGVMLKDRWRTMKQRWLT